MEEHKMNLLDTLNKYDNAVRLLTHEKDMREYYTKRYHNFVEQVDMLRNAAIKAEAKLYAYCSKYPECEAARKLLDDALVAVDQIHAKLRE
jgi:hypothetical protein